MSDVKQRIEAAYERDEQAIEAEAGVDRAGQMTVAFCGGHLTQPD